VRRLQAHFPEVRALRDVTSDMLRAHEMELDDVVFRRCRHVVTEIARTARAADALRAADFAAFGRSMYASHESLRADYEVSVPELDACVEAARSVPGVFGARMTGGGFGGCTVTLVKTGAVEELTKALEGARGRRVDVFVTGAANGACELE